MRVARILCGVVLAALVATGALADEPYLFDLLKQPAYRAAWNQMFKGEKEVDAWIVTFGKTMDGVSSPSRTVTVDGQNGLLGWVCKPHDCGSNQLFVLFAPEGAQAWGMTTDGESPQRWFGSPSDSIQAAMIEASKQQ